MKFRMLDGEQELLDMLLADPDDEASRLVYADWLESMGDLRAEWLRLEIAFHPVSRQPHHHAFRPLRKRLRALLPRIEPEWGMAVSRDPYAIGGYTMWGESAPRPTEPVRQPGPLEAWRQYWARRHERRHPP